jgi:hypothetical protein
MKQTITLLALGLSSTLAIAGPAADSAQAHIQSIAAGDVPAVMAQYQDGASLQWVGGPLDGNYTSKDQLTAVWSKFAKAQGMMTTKVQNLVEHSNPKGATISADVFFTGTKTVPVHYVLSYREGKLVSEIWQVSPALANPM